MTAGKRAFDLVVSILLLALLWPLLAALMLVLLAVEGRPVFYIAERMRTPHEAFGLIKLRTMRPAAYGTRATGVTGGDKSARMSRLHRLLRRSRADELPQLWNVIRGDISLVGPRPPLRIYVDAFPALYERVLRSRPGITGLASLRYHATEERLLAACRSPEETDAVYRRRCVPRKAALDMLYQRHASVGLDLWILAQTMRAVLRRRDGRMLREAPAHSTRRVPANRD
ncbi:MAG: lipopolysaccharide/colanic/teichoic acid biosynthesis glycosyltransferase [Limimaricola cinnabarinus]|jgi:lipopolysaccharide/colanic/teichoic acid biosynthesis glycosyltransferase|uniref:Undecaprenyl-phosphate galactosephosphotransferase n=1 Tax=Limimaricola cinnabarinus LL-001 TaxID=1337093 RepID=U3AA29_9RHOB|nr:sugar transferase [Limimaricola cinnabarinus]GAD54529.1 undecaprenyl-phosphate galactosephosphotransferase [Limimaricola cinnabarinus LL-001]